MIKGAYTMFYSSEPEALRAFIQDKLGFSYSDVGDGWLIFDLPEAEMGCHPQITKMPSRLAHTTYRSTATTLRKPLQS